MNHFVKIRSLLCLVALAITLVSPASALPIVDGMFSQYEGYTSGYNVSFVVESHDDPAPIVTGGQLWLTQDATTNDMYIAFIQPLWLNDNSYGVNSIGWGADAPSGKSHKFQDLLGSDDAQFVFTDGTGETVLDITIDYLAGGGEGGKKGKGKNDPTPPEDGYYLTSNNTDGSLLSAESSLTYNWNLYGETNPELFGSDSYSPEADDLYNVVDPALDGWIFEMVYEFQISGDLFDDGFGDVSIPLAHNSPNKIDKNKTYPQIDDPITTVPEPTSFLLIGLSLTGMVGWRLRSRKK